MTSKKKKMKKLPIWDTRMLMLMENVIGSGKVETQKEFLQSIGFPAENIAQLKRGRQSFRHEHIHRAAVKYGININWIFGLDPEMKRRPGRSPLQQLRDAVTVIEATI